MIREGACKKQFEDRLRESELKFQTLFEQSSLATILYDHEGNLMDINPSALSLFGISAASDLQSWNLFRYPDMTPERLNQLRTGEKIRYRSIIDPDSMHPVQSVSSVQESFLNLEISIFPCRTQTGNISHFFTQIINIPNQNTL